MGTHLIHHKQTTVLDSTYIYTNRLAMPRRTRRIRKENYNKLRLHRVAFVVFVDIREDYNTFDFYIFHQAEQDRIFSRQKLVQTQELSYYVPVFH